MTVFLVGFLLASCAVPPGSVGDGATPPASSSRVSSSAAASAFSAPLADARSRVTKKTFGLFVSPAHSPVSPERFTGYHTGVDFETLPGEQDTDVPVHAVCQGTILFTGWVKGYGGVIVESCILGGSPVTVLYGHLRQSSFSVQSNQDVSPGATLGVLGKGYSAETDGERRHLHLAVHRGNALELRGYVQKKEDLAGWMDPLALLSL